MSLLLFQVQDINDNAPKYIPSSSYNFSFVELQSAGTLVDTVETTDDDGAGLNSLVSPIPLPFSFSLICFTHTHVCLPPFSLCALADIDLML